MTFNVLAILTLGLTVLTALPMSRYERWWVRALDFPRLELAILALILLIVQVIGLDLRAGRAWLLVLPTLLCFGYHAWWILPYTRLWPREVRDATTKDTGQTVRILHANVLISNRQAEPFLGMIRDYQPDIIVVQEPDGWWQAQLDVLESEYPYALKYPLDTSYGMLLYSRLPLKDKATAFLVDEDAPSMHVTVVLRSGDRIRLHSMHPAPPHPEWSLSSSPRDAEMVLLARTTRHEQLPMIVIGDMNEVPWSATQRLFRKVSVLLDPRVGRGLYSTFPAKPPFPRWPLDQVFHSDAFALVHLERLGPIGSDHLPLLVELALEPTAADGQDGLDADGDAEAWAHRKLQSEGSDGNSR